MSWASAVVAWELSSLHGFSSQIAGLDTLLLAGDKKRQVDSWGKAGGLERVGQWHCGADWGRRCCCISRHHQVRYLWCPSSRDREPYSTLCTCCSYYCWNHSHSGHVGHVFCSLHAGFGDHIGLRMIRHRTHNSSVQFSLCTFSSYYFYWMFIVGECLAANPLKSDKTQYPCPLSSPGAESCMPKELTERWCST